MNKNTNLVTHNLKTRSFKKYLSYKNITYLTLMLNYSLTQIKYSSELHLICTKKVLIGH